MPPNLPLHKLSRIVASSALTAIPCRIYAILLNAPDVNSTFKFTNDANGAGTPILNYSVLVADSMDISFETRGGVAFTDKCYITLGGAGAQAYVWYE